MIPNTVMRVNPFAVSAVERQSKVNAQNARKKDMAKTKAEWEKQLVIDKAAQAKAIEGGKAGNIAKAAWKNFKYDATKLILGKRYAMTDEDIAKINSEVTTLRKKKYGNRYLTPTEIRTSLEEATNKVKGQ